MKNKKNCRIFSSNHMILLTQRVQDAKNVLQAL